MCGPPLERRKLSDIYYKNSIQMKIILLIALQIYICSLDKIQAQKPFGNEKMEIAFSHNSKYLWQYKIKQNGTFLNVLAPIFEVNGNDVMCNVKEFKKLTAPQLLKNGVMEYVYQGSIVTNPELTLKVIFRISQDNAVVRYRYILGGADNDKLTKINGVDNIVYSSVSFAQFYKVKEIQFSNYDQKYHSYVLKEQTIEDRFFENNYSAMGPMVVAESSENSFMLAYEHGSQYGNEFLHFNFLNDRTVNISAVKGNYLSNCSISKDNEYETIWFEIAGVVGKELDLASQYRTFMLKYISQNSESRKPYIFYNTWGRQERTNWVGDAYLSSMNLKQTIEEVEQAKNMGIDVFVIDAGWFSKTGDWTLNTSEKFFPDSLNQVVALLKKYNMKLGLWFNPTVAALSSKMLERNVENRTTVNGKLPEPYPIWETEKSVSLCLVSPYWEDYSNVLIRLVKEYGVTYFKWDAIWQGDCDAPGHFHGTTENSRQERQEYDAFLQPVYMNKIVDKVCSICPEAIFDFDITEDGHSVGLSFLSTGKYFAINNGPYYRNYDISKSPASNRNSNIFVNPGPARGWFLRQILSYDKWIPSILFLTHYQPDAPRNSQILNIASLILGQNGIWGEILKTSSEDTQVFRDILGKYKQVKFDITAAQPVNYGSPGELVEIHEKINSENGKGVVVIFGINKREVTYVTKSKANTKTWNNEDVSITFDKEGRAVIKASFSETGAKIIFLGVE